MKLFTMPRIVGVLASVAFIAFPHRSIPVLFVMPANPVLDSSAPATSATEPAQAPTQAPMAPSRAPVAAAPIVIAAPVAIASAASAPENPAALLTIPSLNLKANIQPVGTDSTGAMAVPTTPGTVGWYKDGTAPGDLGSAVLDAHVYLAFKTLKNAKVGTDIYVKKENGTSLHFVVKAIRSYAYTDVPLQELFNQNDGAAHLNLITCSGTWLPSQGTYNQRLVVYATLVS